ncbi:hypothetical protein RFI_39931, partial [Reticulomyxa filosa]
LIELHNLCKKKKFFFKKKDTWAALMALTAFGYRSWRVKKIACDTDHFSLNTSENQMLYTAFRKHVLFNMCTFIGSVIVLIAVVLFDTLAYIAVALDAFANALFTKGFFMFIHPFIVINNKKLGTQINRYIFCMFSPNDIVYFYLCHCYASKAVNESDWEVNDLIGCTSYRIIQVASYIRRRFVPCCNAIDRLPDQQSADMNRTRSNTNTTDTEMTSGAETPRSAPPRMHFVGIIIAFFSFFLSYVYTRMQKCISHYA